ncbi:MAG: hypothetical protein PHC51_11200, partial [bacterium]|nr:hypothetical protein [bacterium]
MDLFFAINFSPQRRKPSPTAVICQLLLIAVTIFVCSSPAYALDKYWIGPPGGNFSDDANWSITDGTCGVAPDTTAPGVGDSANFDGGCNNDITIDVSVSVDSIYIWSGYAGTITQASGASITTTSALTQEAGSFVGSDAPIDVGGVFSITGGSFSAPASTLSLAAGFYQNGGTVFDAGTGTVIFTATGDVIGRGTGTAVDDSNYDFNNLIVNPGVVLTVLATELEVDGTLTISAGGTLQLDEKRLDLNGTLSNLGTLQLDGTQLVEISSMDTDSGLVRYVGASSTVIPASITAYFNLDFDESGASNPTYTLPATDIIVNGSLDVTDGELAFSATNNLQIAGPMTIAATGSLTNTGVGDLILGSTVANAGAISFDSSGAGAGDADSIQIRSTTGGTRRNWQGAGSFSLIDVDAQDQSAAGGTPAFINVSSGTDSGNNLNWVFGAELGLSLSGTVYNGKAEGGTLAGKGVKVAHYDGSSLSQYTLTTNGGGAFSISNILLSSGEVLVFYLNDEAEEGTLVYVSDGASHGDLKLYQGVNLIRSDTGAVSNATLFAAYDGDDDIKYQVSGANVTFDSSFEVFIASGTTYTPGGTVTGGAFDINGTLDMAGNDITVSGNWDATGGVYTSGANTTTFAGTTTLISGGVDANHDFNNVTLSGDLALSTNTIDINGNLLIDATRTLDTNGQNINLAGDWTNNGIFIRSTGTVTFDGVSNITPGTTGATQYFNDIVISGTATPAGPWLLHLEGDMTITGTLSNINNRVIQVKGGWSNSGSFVSGLSTVYFMGNGIIDAGGTGIAVDDATKDFNNVIIQAGILSLGGSELEVDGTLTLWGATELHASGQSLDLNGTLDNGGTVFFDGSEAVEIGVMDSDSGTVIYEGTVSTTINNNISSYNFLGFDESGVLDPVYTLPAVNISANAVSVIDGTVQFSAANNLSTWLLNISAGQSLINNGTGDLTISGSVSNAGTISFDSSGGGAGDADGIQIRSDIPGTRRNWQGAGTYSLIDVDVQDQTAIGGAPSLITTTSSTNSGNNVNWVFDAAPDTLSGVVFNGKAEAGTVAGKAVRLVHYNGAVRTTFDTVTDGSGNFSIASIDLQSGDPLIIFLNDEAESGNLLYVSDGVGHADLKLYQNEVAIRTDAGSGLTNTQMQLVDDGDADIHYNVSGGNLTIESAYELYIYTGSTFLPAGAVTGGAFDINGTLDAAGNDVTVGGAWDATGGVYTSGANTTTFNGTTTLITGGTDANHDFHHVTLSGDVTVSTNDIDINGNLLINATRTLDASGRNIALAGDYTNSGTFTPGAGTLTFDGTGNINSGGVAVGKQFNNVIVSGVATIVTNHIWIDGNLSITGTLSDVNNFDINLGGNWTNSGTFTSGTGIVYFWNNAVVDSGATAGVAIDDTTKDFHDIIIMGGDTVTLSGSALEVDNTLTISAAAFLLLDGQDLDLNGTLLNDGTLDLLGTEAVEIGVMDTNSGLVKYTGTTSTTIPAAFATYFNVEFDESGILDPVWTLPAVDVAVNGTLAITDGTLAFSAANNLTVTGTTTVAAAGVFLNEGDGDFTIGATVTNSGAITFDSAGGGIGDPDNILIRSTTTARRDWAGTGTFTMIDVDVNRMTAISGTPTGITVDSGTNSGRCINWYFDGLPNTITGVAYTSKAEGATLNGRNLRMRHEAGGITSNYDTTTDGSGNFTFTAVDLQPGDAIVIFLNGEPVDGNLIYVSDGNDVLNLKFYQDAVALRDDSGGAGITNAMMLALDNGDSDIRYAVTGSDIVFQTAFEVFIFAGTIYLPGGTVTGGAFDINGTFDANGNDVTVSGNWDATGGVYTSGANTTTFNATTTLISGGIDDNHDFHNFSVTGSVTISTDNLDIDGNLSVTGTGVFNNSLHEVDIFFAGNYAVANTAFAYYGGAASVSVVTFDGITSLASGGSDGNHDLPNTVISGSVTLTQDTL